MSIPNHEIDEQDDDDVCIIHDWSMPCPHCHDDEADRRYDDQLNERMDHA